MTEVICPGCHKRLLAPEGTIGDPCCCPACAAVFTPRDVLPHAPPRPPETGVPVDRPAPGADAAPPERSLVFGRLGGCLVMAGLMGSGPLLTLLCAEEGIVSVLTNSFGLVVAFGLLVLFGWVCSERGPLGK